MVLVRAGARLAVGHALARRALGETCSKLVAVPDADAGGRRRAGRARHGRRLLLVRRADVAGVEALGHLLAQVLDQLLLAHEPVALHLAPVRLVLAPGAHTVTAPFAVITRGGVSLHEDACERLVEGSHDNEFAPAPELPLAPVALDDRQLEVVVVRQHAEHLLVLLQQRPHPRAVGEGHGVADHAHAVLRALRPDASAHALCEDLEPHMLDGRLLLGAPRAVVIVDGIAVALDGAAMRTRNVGDARLLWQ